MKNKIAILIIILIIASVAFTFVKLSEEIPAPTKKVERDIDINQIFGNM